MKTKITLVAILAVTAGAFLWMRPHSGVPADLRDAVAEQSAIGQLPGGTDTVVPEPRIERTAKSVTSTNRVVCSIHQLQNTSPTDSGMWKEIDTLILGQDEGGYALERGKPINGTEGLAIYGSYGSNYLTMKIVKLGASYSFPKPEELYVQVAASLAKPCKVHVPKVNLMVWCENK